MTWPVPELLGALLQIADPARLHYGSDRPFTPIEGCAHLPAALEAASGPGAALSADILRGNALALFPRLQDA